MQNERTFIAVKPEAIQKHLIGEIITRFEKRGLKLVGIKLAKATTERIAAHYSEDNDWEVTGTRTLAGYEAQGKTTEGTPVEGKNALEVGMWVRDKLMQSLVGKTVVAMVWQGPHAVQLGRRIVGHTNPLQAEPGTIRGDFSVDSYELGDAMERPVRNFVHASGEVDEAQREIAVWFDEDELVDYPLLTEEVYYGDTWGNFA